MMPQRDASESMSEQAGPTYGKYEGEQTYDAHRQYEIPYEQPLRNEPLGKVYLPQHDNKNMLRLVAFAIAMVTLLAFAVICLIIVRGTGGWISFCAASLAIFIVAVVAIDKIK